MSREYGVLWSVFSVSNLLSVVFCMPLTATMHDTQVPMGIGHHFRGVVDVIERKAYEYKGNYGEKREEIAVPEVYRTQVDVRPAFQNMSA